MTGWEGGGPGTPLEPQEQAQLAWSGGPGPRVLDSNCEGSQDPGWPFSSAWMSF